MYRVAVEQYNGYKRNEPLDYELLSEMFMEEFDDNHKTVEIAGETFGPSFVLRSLDPEFFGHLVNEYMSSLELDGVIVDDGTYDDSVDDLEDEEC